VRRFGLSAFVFALSTGTAAAQGPDPALLAKACVVCHSASQPGAGLMLDKIDADHIGRDAEVWEKIARKLRSGFHPPAGPTRPPTRALDAFAQSVERALDRLDASNWSAAAAAPASDLEMASRLSAFLWRSWPDEELLELAAAGRLRQPPVLEQQTRRMLADPRADALISNFFNQWLMLRNLPSLRPDPKLFPGFDDNLRQGLLRETELFLRSQVRDDRGVPELLTATYTFVNDRVARHYGLANVSGSHFRRITWPDSRRAGLLGHASILAITSYSNRTSPVLRGKWLLETFFGTPVPPVPANVPRLPEDAVEAPATPMRTRLDQHTRNPACASCHVTLDPLGYALENFDGVGRWRTLDAGTTIDTSSTLPDGTAIHGPDGLRKLLAARREVFVTTVVDRLMTYALGRRITHYDMPSVRGIVRDAAAAEYRWSAVIAAIVRSTPFQMKRTEQR
jgi:cytochrome c551/c552